MLESSVSSSSPLMTTPPSAKTKVPLRSRRYHKRSKNGCLTCIQRHIRCDESKPYCGYCLARGYGCEYRSKTEKSPVKLAVASLPSSSQGEIVQRKQSPQTLNTILGQMDVFNSLPVELANPSIKLLHHFSSYTMHRRSLWSIKNNPTHQKWCNFAISDPALLHASLALAAGNWIYLNGEMVAAYYHHKAEAMRMINENLADPTKATSDATVGAIVHLIMTESIYGSSDVATVHLNGLKHLLHIRGDIHTDRINFVLVRLIQMAILYGTCASQPYVRFSHTSDARIVPKKAPTGSLDISPKVVFNSNIDIVIHEIDLLDQGMLDSLQALREVSSRGAETGNTSSNQEYNDRINYLEKNLKTQIHRLKTRPRGENVIEWHGSNNLYWPVSLLVYFLFFVKRVPGSNAVYNNLVRELKDSLERSQSPHFQRIWPPELVLWMLIVGCVVAWERVEGPWFRKELVVCQRGLGITSWKRAEQILGEIVWIEGIGGPIAKRMWNELDLEIV